MPNIKPVFITQAYLKEVATYDKENGEFRWRITRLKAKAGKLAGNVHRPSGYRQIKIDGHVYHAHRLAWLYVHGEWPQHLVDHIDGNRDNNVLANLRAATDAENSRNGPARKRGRQSGYKGVRWFAPARKWRARIVVDYKDIHLGLFDDPYEAHLAYREASKRYHGAFGRID
jgi:hypothetical protein